MGSAVGVAGQIKKYVTQLNFFENEISRSNPFHLRTSIISTRVYIALLSVCLIIIVVFNSLDSQFQVETLRNPSAADYEALLKQNVSSLSCPCSHVTIPYGNVTSTTIDYHPVCSSVFVSDDWINHLFSPDIGRMYQADFRASASSLFRLLATFCSQANRSVHDGLEDFHTETLLTPYVLSPDSFEVQVQVKSRFLRLSIANSVRRLLQIVRSTTHANGLLTALQTSKIFSIDEAWGGRFSLKAVDTRFYTTDSKWCKCTAWLNCSIPSGFFNISYKNLSQDIVSTDASIETLPGFFVGCNPVESLLQSTLECLFNRSCLQTIRTFIPSTNIIDVNTLNINQTHFAVNMSIKAIINSLFIENWSTNQSFSNYFVQCAPILCTYTSVKRNSALYVLTKLLGLYGGLTTTLRLCIPLIISWWYKRRVNDSGQPRPSEY
jgi:hypothetical protein